MDLPRASNSPNDDEIWAAVDELVDGKVGPPYQDEDVRKAEEEAERRRSAKIPLGFKDERLCVCVVLRLPQALLLRQNNCGGRRLTVPSGERRHH